jgi:hypothetical protein
VAFQEASGGLNAVSLVTRDKQKRVLSDGWSTITGLDWTPDGAEVRFSAAGADGWGIYAVTPAGKTRLVLPLPSRLSLEDIGSDGQLLIASETPQTGIRFAGAGTQEGDLSWLDGSRLADLSEDGTRILFTEAGAAGGTTGAVYLRKTDRSPAVRLGSGIAEALSPDGQSVLTFTRSPVAMTVLPTGAGSAVTLKGTFARYAGAQWLPDSKHILFSALEPGHDTRLYVQEVGGEPRPISDEGLIIGAAVAPDGRIATTLDHTPVILNAAGGPPQPLPALKDDEYPVAWTADGRSLYVRGRGDTTAEIALVDVATGVHTPWKTLAPADRAGTIAVGAIRIARDGKSYAYSYTRVLADLYLVNGVK